MSGDIIVSLSSAPSVFPTKEENDARRPDCLTLVVTLMMGQCLRCLASIDPERHVYPWKKKNLSFTNLGDRKSNIPHHGPVSLTRRVHGVILTNEALHKGQVLSAENRGQNHVDVVKAAVKWHLLARSVHTNNEQYVVWMWIHFPSTTHV